MMSPESFWRLGTAFARVLLRKWFGSRRPQLPTFVDHYQRDGIVLFEPGDSAVVANASQCIACGRCDTQALMDDTYECLGRSGPMAFVLGVSRHSGEHDAAEITAQATPRALDALSAVCPAGVRFAPLADLVKRRRAALVATRSS